MPDHRIRFAFRQLAYDLRSGLLLRPGLITAALTVLAVALVYVDSLPAVRTVFTSGRTELLRGEPASTQALLGTIAGSMMTVVAVVYSILIMVLSLASIQFSPRILGSLIRDRLSQTTLGLFVGTFIYCLWVLRSVESDPAPFVPALGVTGAIVLSLVCLGSLIYFLHHISKFIQVNYLVDIVARETEDVITETFPDTLTAEEVPEPIDERFHLPAEGLPVDATESGYVQLINRGELVRLARNYRLCLHVHRTTGEFVIQGRPLLSISPPERATPRVVKRCRRAFDLGPVRTMQADVEFGFRQIVDIALKAISPAVNDPSTAATCIDHLGNLLCLLATRRIPATITVFPDDERPNEVGARGRFGGACLILGQTTFGRVLDLSVNQIRQYGKSDMAVALRLIRMLTEVAHVVRSPADRQRIWEHAREISAAAAENFEAMDSEELERRLCQLERIVGGADGESVIETSRTERRAASLGEERVDSARERT